jgi:hypothetical protein
VTISIYAGAEGVSLIGEISGFVGFPPKNICFRAAEFVPSFAWDHSLAQGCTTGF